MKKIMAFILCLAIGLTGCSSSNPDKDTGTISNAESITNFEESNIEFSGMDDDALLTYVKDKVYEETAVISAGAPAPTLTTDTVTQTKITPVPIATFFITCWLSVSATSCNFSTVVVPSSLKLKIYLSP